MRPSVISNQNPIPNQTEFLREKLEQWCVEETVSEAKSKLVFIASFPHDYDKWQREELAPFAQILMFVEDLIKGIETTK